MPPPGKPTTGRAVLHCSYCGTDNHAASDLIGTLCEKCGKAIFTVSAFLHSNDKRRGDTATLKSECDSQCGYTTPAADSRGTPRASEIDLRIAQERNDRFAECPVTIASPFPAPPTVAPAARTRWRLALVIAHLCSGMERGSLRTVQNSTRGRFKGNFCSPRCRIPIIRSHPHR